MRGDMEMRSFGAVWQEYMDIRCGAKVAQQNRRFKGINTGGRERQEGGLRRFVREGRNRASERANERARAVQYVSSSSSRGTGAGEGSPRGLLLVAGPLPFLSFRLHPPFKGRLNVRGEARDTGHYRNMDRPGREPEQAVLFSTMPCLEGVTASVPPRKDYENS